MRDYSKVSPRFWTGSTCRTMRKFGQTELLVSLYLMTAPTSNMLGIYHVPMVMIAHAVSATIEAVEVALSRLESENFCTYDNESEWVWVHEMARWQIEPELKSIDNRIAAVAKEWRALPELPFLARFSERYARAFHLPLRTQPGHSLQGSRKPLDSPFQGPAEPLRSQEQEQEQEQDEKTGAAPVGSALPPVASPSLFGPEEHVADVGTAPKVAPGDKPTGAKRKRSDDEMGTRLPKDWVLPDTYRAEAKRVLSELNRSDIDIQIESNKFRDHWVGKPGKEGRRSDWLCTWRNWIRKSCEYQRAPLASRSSTAPSRLHTPPPGTDYGRL